MIVLDTNVVSELMKEFPDEAVWHWFVAHRREGLYTTAITAAEVHYGIERLPVGRRRRQVSEAADEIFGGIEDEVLSFTAEAAMAFPVVVTSRGRAGLPIQSQDAQIAAICLVEEAALATRNTKDFVKTGVELLNPWE
jgi:predicted nucleic acid-binding protein